MALKLDERNKTAWNGLGSARMAGNDYKGAADAFDRALAYDPEYSNAWYNGGVCYYELGYRDEAIGYFENAADDPKFYRDATLNKAKIYGALAELEEAENSFNALTNRYPKDREIWLEWARVYRDLDEMSNALLIYKEFMVLDPGDAAGWYEVATLYAEADDAALAGKLLGKAGSLDKSLKEKAWGDPAFDKVKLEEVFIKMMNAEIGK